MINAIWLFLIVLWCFIFGVFLYAILISGKRADEIVPETMDKEERLEIIEEVFNDYGDCEHDVEGPSADYDGHHFISYSIDKKGKEKILEAL